jgi:sugar lactone lactonase YvrE
MMARSRCLVVIAACGWLIAAGGLTIAAAQEEAPANVAQTGPRLDFPAGVASDGVAVYVANSRNNTIVKIDIGSHAISLVAGKLFTKGSNDGKGDGAAFSSPDGLALVENALYVVDAENSDIRKIELGTQNVTTVFGTANISGSENGAGAAAHFNLPTQIASDGKSLYVADTGNSTIRKINLADKVVTTIGGQAQSEGKDDGPAAKSSFSRPRGIATDGKFVYVGDTANQLIRKIDLSNKTTSTLAGQAGVEGMQNGTATEATFSNPEALATDGAFLYVADADNHAVRKISLADGKVSTITQVNGHIGSGLALSKDGHTVFFSDTTENAIQALDIASGNFMPVSPTGAAP